MLTRQYGWIENEKNLKGVNKKGDKNSLYRIEIKGSDISHGTTRRRRLFRCLRASGIA